ncbi:M15 family metallopeptidase [Demequina sp. B12]|uniref:M15 family metallopeptidase n=1 Tax=Demequina sp. B12 TaxID=2992757 RepID=UPI00237A4249|nr:M15 family metallopeptidase [Demequina sp. B12]MDE0573754.1 M15 family metallopeptidase [Demequina sp. B12]
MIRGRPSHVRKHRRPFPWATGLVVVVAVLAGTAAARTHDAVLDGGSVAGVFGDAVEALDLATDTQVTVSAPVIDAVTAGEVSSAPMPVPQVSQKPWSQHSLDDPASLWVVVNKARPLDPLDYVPTGMTSVGGVQMVAEAAEAMEQMRAAAAQAGASFSISNAYRPYSEQRYLHSQYQAEFGTAITDRGSLRPGYSEHQTGLAADVYASAACRIKTCFADETAGRWIADHAHEFGFVVRYPVGLEATTGIRYEPWHVRYVGVDLAAALVESGQTMEQFFGLPAAPDYLD